MNPYRLFPALGSSIPRMVATLDVGETRTVEDFMASVTTMSTIFTAAASTDVPAKFSTGLGSGTTTAITSQVQVLQSILDFYNAYASGSQSIFAAIKIALDAVVLSYTGISTTCASNYAGLSYTDPRVVPSGGYNTDMVNGATLDSLVSIYNTNRDTSGLFANIRTAARTENMPNELYTTTYTEARKYIQDADISTVTATVTTAYGYLTPGTTTPTDAYAGSTGLAITGTEPTLASVRTSFITAIRTIVNALVTKYNQQASATETSLPDTATLVEIRAKRTDILGKWATLLQTRIGNVTTLIGNPATTDTGTYQSNRVASGCTPTDTGTANCWSDTAITTRKGYVNTRVALVGTGGLITYNYGTATNSYVRADNVMTTFQSTSGWSAVSGVTTGTAYTTTSSDISRISTTSGSSTNNVNKVFQTTSTSAYSLASNAIITFAFPSTKSPRFLAFTSNSTTPGHFVVSGTHRIPSISVGTFNITLNISDLNTNITLPDGYETITLKNVSANAVTIYNLFFKIINTVATLVYPGPTPAFSSYDIVNDVYTTFNNAQAGLLQTARGLATTALNNFRTAYTNISSYLPASYTNQSDITTADTDSKPDVATSTDGQAINGPTATYSSLSAIRTKYENALRYLYNAVLAFMDIQIADYNALLSRYNSFRQDADVNQLYPNFSGQTIQQSEIPTKEYGIDPKSTTPTMTEIASLQSLSKLVPTNQASYTSLTQSLVTTVQAKLFIFFQAVEATAASIGFQFPTISTELSSGQTPTRSRLIDIMNAFAGIAGSSEISNQDVQLISAEQSQTQTRMAAFYADTYIPYVRYLTATDAADTTIQGAVTKCLAYYYNANGTTKSFAALSGGDTQASLRTTMDNGIVAFVQKLVDRYSTTRATWAYINEQNRGRGMPTTSAAGSNLTVTNENAVATRDIYINQPYWPKLVQDITNFTKSLISNTSQLRAWYTGSASTNVTVGGKTTKGMGRPAPAS